MCISNTFISYTILACGVRVVKRKCFCGTFFVCSSSMLSERECVCTFTVTSLYACIRVCCLLFSYQTYAEIATYTSYAEMATYTSQQTLTVHPAEHTAPSPTLPSSATLDLLHLLPLPNHFTWYLHTGSTRRGHYSSKSASCNPTNVATAPTIGAAPTISPSIWLSSSRSHTTPSSLSDGGEAEGTCDWVS